MKTINFIKNLTNFETLSIKKIRAHCEIEGLANKDVSSAIKELELGGGGSTFKTDFYAALVEGEMSEEAFNDIIEASEGKNVKAHKSAHRQVWTLVQQIRADLEA